MSYDVVRVLGRGGSAVVELAVAPDGTRVATKRLALAGSDTQMRIARQRLRREAEILGELADPGIVPILDVVDDGHDVVLVLPLMTENLEDRVRRLGPLGPDEVIRIGRVLIGALAAAHRRGIVHRDIKPANVLFDHDGAPALADFGAAVTWETTAGLTLAGTVVGTPMWMAPEQARGETASPASDVFSLAATLVFASTGQGPYEAGPGSVVIARAARGDIRAVPATVPAALRRPLDLMLDPDPVRRPSAARVLGGLEGTTVTTAPGPQETAGRPARARRVTAGLWRLLVGTDPAPTRRRWLGIATVATVVVLVAGIAVLGTTHRGGHLAAPRRSAAGRQVRVTPATVCHPSPYLPCGTSSPAPHTDGRTCDAGWYDLDGLEADGCEAHSDFVAGTSLTATTAVHANIVPADGTDSFATPVQGHALDLCWGTLHVTLTAPAHTAEQLTLWDGTTKLATALSANGVPATAATGKPSCFGADSEDLRTTVTAVAAGGDSSATDFTLTRDGGW